MSLKTRRPKVAYVKSKKSDKFLFDRATGELLQVHIKEAIRVRTDNHTEHESRIYTSLHTSPERRYRVRVIDLEKQGIQMYGRYSEKGEALNEFDQHYDESMSHRCAVEALSSLISMTFFDSETGFKETFDFTSVQKEPYVKLPNGAVYYPDILCTFEESHKMYDRWGGKLAIEVTYKHACESYKTEDFMFHNIPVIEVVIEDGSSRQFPPEKPDWQGDDNWDKSLEIKHTQKLAQWFSQGIGAKLIVDPVSTRVHKQILCEKAQEINNLKMNGSLADEKLSKLNQHVRELLNKTKACESSIDNKKQELRHREDEYEQQISNIQSSTSSKINELNRQLINKDKTKEMTIKLCVSFCVVWALLVFILPALYPYRAAEIIKKYLIFFAELWA